MSDTDSVIEEVNEELQQDKLYGYLRKYGWIAIVAILGTVGGATYLEINQSREILAAQTRGDGIIAALEQDDAAERASALGALVPASGNASVVIAMRQAGELEDAGQTTEAVAVLMTLAENAAAEPAYRDLALLKAVILQGADMDQTERGQILASLAAPGGGFRPLALEQQANMAIETGDTDTAVARYIDVLEDPVTTSALRNRAQQMIVALGGELPETTSLLSGQ